MKGIKNGIAQNEAQEVNKRLLKELSRLRIKKKFKKRILTLDGFDYKELKIARPSLILSKKLRYSVVEWLYIINSKLGGASSTLYHSIFLFDSFCAKAQNEYIFNSTDLFAGVCYLISTKLYEIAVMSIGFLQKIILKEKYTEEDIVKTELEIIQKLNFDLNYDTVVNYSQYLVSKINIKQDIKKKLSRHVNSQIFCLRILTRSSLINIL